MLWTQQELTKNFWVFFFWSVTIIQRSISIYFIHYFFCKFFSTTCSNHFGKKAVKRIDPSSNTSDWLQWLTETSLCTWKSFDFHSSTFCYGKLVVMQLAFLCNGCYEKPRNRLNRQKRFMACLFTGDTEKCKRWVKKRGGRAIVIEERKPLIKLLLNCCLRRWIIRKKNKARRTHTAAAL